MALTKSYGLSYEGAANLQIEEGGLHSTEQLTIIEYIGIDERRNLLPSLWSVTR